MDLNELEPKVTEEEIAAESPPEEVKAEEAPKEPAKAEEMKDDKPVKVVPHQALHEERERRKQAEAKFRQLEQNQAILNDRLTQLYQAAQPQAPQPPTFDVDPLQNLKAGQDLTQQQLQYIAQKLQQDEAARAQQAQVQQLVGWAQSEAQGFRKETPDFDNAYQHIRSIRAGELGAMGLEPQAIQQTLLNDELWVYQHAAQTGRNPAQVIYEMAKRTGYTGQKQTQAAQKMETLQKGVEAAKTLGTGGAASGNPTLEQLAEMNDDDFAAFKAKIGKNGKRISDVV